MTECLVWKDLEGGNIETLSNCHDVGECKRLLGEYLGVSQVSQDNAKQAGILQDLFFYALVFCKESDFSPEKTSTFVSILKTMIDFDVESATCNMGESFQHFRSLLLAHSVERPPESTGIFSVSDATLIVNYVTNSYFRHHNLYKYALTTRRIINIQQLEQGGVDVIRDVAPLSQAFARKSAMVQTSPRVEETADIEANSEVPAEETKQ